MDRRCFVVSLTAASASAYQSAFAGAESDSLTQPGAAQQTVSPRYRVHNLDPLGTGWSYARCVSSDGKTAGFVTLDIAGQKRPAIFERGKLPVPIYTDGRGEATGINSLR